VLRNGVVVAHPLPTRTGVPVEEGDASPLRDLAKDPVQILGTK
jgi:hypothetical protein